jgi:uncharacterized protein YbdZ (MbtH family)
LYNADLREDEMTNTVETEETTMYQVVVNHEEQYSIWPEHKEIPPGWKHAGKTGLKTDCLAHIKEVWTNMRPLSLRKKMEEFARNPPPPAPIPNPNAPRAKSLVDRLSEGDHTVAVGLRPEKTVKLFKEAIDRGYVHIRFTETKGGTELGFRLDHVSSNFKAADFENGKGTAHLEGNLTLDYVKVKCVADIDLSTLEGNGHLVKLDTSETAAA